LPGKWRYKVFDEVFDMFERDGRRSRPAGERRGLRGFFARMFGDSDDHDDSRRYESDHDDDTRRSRYDDDEYEGRPGQRRRERDNDVFDFGD
jgi:hypothetical protein